jgi:hypothetical protein
LLIADKDAGFHLGTLVNDPPDVPDFLFIACSQLAAACDKPPFAMQFGVF